MPTTASSPESLPRSTSAFSETLDTIVKQAAALERLASSAPSALGEDPRLHVIALQEAMNALQDKMGSIEGLVNDNDMFGRLSSLHGRKVDAGIELCVKWAQSRIDALLILIRDTDGCALQIGEEVTTRQWWHTPRDTDDTINHAIDAAERAYEQAAITVQSLHPDNQHRLMPAVTEMKSSLRSIVEREEVFVDENVAGEVIVAEEASA